MERRGRPVGAAVIAVLVGAALVGVGVWVWMDGNTPFGVAAIVIGAIVLLGFLRSAVRRRKAK